MSHPYEERLAKKMIGAQRQAEADATIERLHQEVERLQNENTRLRRDGESLSAQLKFSQRLNSQLKEYLIAKEKEAEKKNPPTSKWVF